MLPPRNVCSIEKPLGKNIHGEPTFAPAIAERCSIVKSKERIMNTTVRADSSASRGYGDEFVNENDILLTPKTSAKPQDRITVAGIALRIISLRPQFDVWGVLDHYVVEGRSWA
jgi:hypothetical protein